MFNKRYNRYIYLSAIGLGTLIAFFCPTRVLIVILALLVVVLGLSISRY